jgi:hypothetical protein
MEIITDVSSHLEDAKDHFYVPGISLLMSHPSADCQPGALQF